MFLESGLSESLSDLLLRVIEDIRQAVKKDLKEGVLCSLYLVGSAVLQPPPLVWVGTEPVVTSDLDLLLFVRQGTAICERRAMTAAINAAKLSWGAYRSIHVGYRFRPVSAVARTVAEYASWGVDMEYGVIRLCGAPLIETLPEEEGHRWMSRSYGLLLANALSKLWFVIYSVPHDDLQGDLAGIPALVLRQRFASAAKRLTTLHALAWSRSEGKLFDRDMASEVRWRPRLLRSGMESLATGIIPERGNLDRFERAGALELVMLAVREIVKLLGADSGVPWARQGWEGAVLSMGELLASGEPDMSRLSRAAASVLCVDNCVLDGGEDREATWPKVVRTLHRAQFLVLSRNLVSYS
jgi:hypothetical protein